MTKKEAINRIKEILIKLGVDFDEVGIASEKIWADVVVTAVDDEREQWIAISARKDSDIN